MTHDTLEMRPPVDALAGAFINFKTSVVNNLAVMMFVREATGRCLRQVARDQVPTSIWSVDLLGDFGDEVDTFDGPPEGDKAWMLRHRDGSITLVHVLDGWAHIATAGEELAQVESTCARVADAIRAAQVEDDDVTPITFWGLNPHRFPRAMRRNLKTYAWHEIVANYDDETRGAMERLFELEDTPEARMILWHGPAGTGKTHALRALAREWSGWCNVAYITDPEEFIGGSGTYSPTYLFDVANFQAGYGVTEARRRSTLIVLEDAGELMTGEARQRSGQGLSRLLNLTDGLMGQGLRVMVLITTNEPLSSLHPAVVRPGRCLAEIEFGPLSVDQANHWLEQHGSSASVDEPTSLATLYAIAGGHTPNTTQLATVA